METWLINENSLYVWEDNMTIGGQYEVHVFHIRMCVYVQCVSSVAICCVCTVCIFCCNVLCTVIIPQCPSKLQGEDVQD